MPLNTNKLLEAYYSGMLQPLRQSLIWPSLCNRDYQQNFVDGAYDLKIPTAVTDRDAQTVARNADWIAATDADLDYTTVSITKQAMMSSSIPYLDEHQTPVSLIEREREIHTRGFSSKIDKDVASVIVSGVPNANIEANAHNNQPYLNNKGGWASQRSQDNTEAKQDAVMENLYEFLAGYGVEAAEGGWDRDGASTLAVWAVAPPQIARPFNKWLRKQNLTTELNTQLIREGRMTGLGSRIFTRIEGISVISTPRVPSVAGVSGTTPPYYQVIVGTRAGASFASLPPLRQLFSPQENQSAKLGWLLRATWMYDAWVQYSDTFAIYRIPSGRVPA